MQRQTSSLAAPIYLAALLGATAPAHAAFVAFASPDGAPGNTCLTAADPCREIFQAIDKIDAGGTIFVAPGEYGAFGVDESMNVISDAGPAIVGDSELLDLTAIRIEITATEKVLLRGFVANVQEATAITVIGGGTARLENCTFIAGSTNRFGINYAPTATSELYVTNSVVSASTGNTGASIRIAPAGSATVKVAFDGVHADDGTVGILVDGSGTSGIITMNVRDSTISGNSAQGLAVFEAVSGAPSAIVLERTTVSGNVGQGIVASRDLASIRVRQSAITGNGVGVQSLNGGQIISHGDNLLANNSANGAFTATLPPQ
jgi:hypothetical protein